MTLPATQSRNDLTTSEESPDTSPPAWQCQIVSELVSGALYAKRRATRLPHPFSLGPGPPGYLNKHNAGEYDVCWESDVDLA